MRAHIAELKSKVQGFYFRRLGSAAQKGFQFEITSKCGAVGKSPNMGLKPISILNSPVFC